MWRVDETQRKIFKTFHLKIVLCFNELLIKLMILTQSDPINNTATEISTTTPTAPMDTDTGRLSTAEVLVRRNAEVFFLSIVRFDFKESSSSFITILISSIVRLSKNCHLFSPTEEHGQKQVGFVLYGLF